MTEAGADVIVAHMGLATSGVIVAQTAPALDDRVKRPRYLGGGEEDKLDCVIGIATPGDVRYVIEQVALTLGRRRV